MCNMFQRRPSIVALFVVLSTLGTVLRSAQGVRIFLRGERAPHGNHRGSSKRVAASRQDGLGSISPAGV